jgi:hypothetical protein
VSQVLVGGKLPPASTLGQFYPPTVIVDVTPEMRMWTEEVFGPILPVVKVKTDAEAVAVANDCAFGLGSSVFSRSQVRAGVHPNPAQLPAPFPPACGLAAAAQPAGSRGDEAWRVDFRCGPNLSSLPLTLRYTGCADTMMRTSPCSC